MSIYWYLLIIPLFAIAAFVLAYLRNELIDDEQIFWLVIFLPLGIIQVASIMIEKHLQRLEDKREQKQKEVDLREVEIDLAMKKARKELSEFQ